MPDDSILIKADIRLLSSTEGGRDKPIRGSYRPNHNFFGPNDRVMTTGFINLPDGKILNPGESIEIEIQFWKWPGLDGQIYRGRQWRIQEGAKLVGIGTVLDVLLS